MLVLKKILSTILVTVLLVAVTGVSVSKHVCFSGKSFTCATDENCCKDKHSESKKNKCCSVEDFYFKADIVSTHDNIKHKVAPENFVSDFNYHFFGLLTAAFSLSHSALYKPPILGSSRSILLDSSRLTI